MENFIHDNFLLQNTYAEKLYHEHAKGLPIIDYHSHLDAKLIADDYCFDNLTEIWLAGDHYKWRALRTNGVSEEYITGTETSDWEKFTKWAETVPYTMRNPLYHWTHLELKTAFGVNRLLDINTAKEVYDHCSALLKTKAFSTRELMRKYNVKVVCTTDDPIDSLVYHKQLKSEGFEIKVLPTWRPDKAMGVERKKEYIRYLKELGDLSGIVINSFEKLIKALRKRQDYFESNGCRLSDHGVEWLYSMEYTDAEIENIFNKINGSISLSSKEIEQFKSAVLYECAKMNWEKGWVQQFHFGVIRNNSSRLFNKIGPDAGGDSVADFDQGLSLARFLDRLDSGGYLTKSIFYNLNSRDNDLVATMIGNFQDGSFPGKIQFGSGWWFLDQKQGMENQLNTLSNQGLLSRFVGMLTDSRSFLSFPRHEYFRRIMCNLIGDDIDKGLLPSSQWSFIAKMVENISYYNAKNYFDF